MEELVVSKREAGAVLGVSARTIHRMLARGELKGIRIGKRRKLVLCESIKKLVEAQSK